MRERLAAALPTIGVVFGILSNVTGVLGYLNVTPEMVGRTAYGIFYIALPLVMFLSGAIFGWGATRLWYAHKERSIRPRLESLTDAQLATVVLLYRLGTEAIIPSYEVCSSLEVMGMVRRLEGASNTTVWDLTPDTRKAIHSDRKTREEIECLDIGPDMMRQHHGHDGSRYVI